MEWYSNYYKKRNFQIFKKSEDKKKEREKNYLLKSENLGKNFQIKISFENNGKNINKKIIFLSTTFLISFILVVLFIFAPEKKYEKFEKPLDIRISNLSDINSKIFYNKMEIFSFSASESLVFYNEKNERLFGKETKYVFGEKKDFKKGNIDYRYLFFDDYGKAYTFSEYPDKIIIEPLTTNPNKVEKIGMFTDLSKVKIERFDQKNRIEIKINFQEDQYNSGLIFDFYKSKPFFKIRFNSDNPKIKNFNYGFIFYDYDLYLQNGSVLKNDHKEEYSNSNKKIFLKTGNETSEEIPEPILSSLSNSFDINKKEFLINGTYYELESEYEIFVNKNKKLAVVMFSDYPIYFKNSFYWNVYRVNSYKEENGFYSPVYFVVLENPNLIFKNQKWNIDKEGSLIELDNYLADVLYEIYIKDFDN